MGRKAKGENARSETLSIRLTRRDAAMLDILAAESGRSKAGVVLDALYKRLFPADPFTRAMVQKLAERLQVDEAGLVEAILCNWFSKYHAEQTALGPHPVPLPELLFDSDGNQVLGTALFDHLCEHHAKNIKEFLAAEKAITNSLSGTA